MFGWFKKKQASAGGDAVAHQPPNEVFPWPKGVTITAVDELVIAIPLALLDPDRPMQDFIFGPDGMGFQIPSGSDVCLLRLEPGMAVNLAKPCQAYIVAGDGRPRQLRVSGPGVKPPSG